MFRWLLHYIIIKGGILYIFKLPPADSIKNVQHKLSNLLYENCNGSSGSSIGSVASSTSDASSCKNVSYSQSLQHLPRTKCKLDKINKEFDNSLSSHSTEQIQCYKSDMRLAKPNELWDTRPHCLVINTVNVHNNCIQSKLFSADNANHVESILKCWDDANHQSVLKLKVMSFLFQTCYLFTSIFRVKHSLSY